MNLPMLPQDKANHLVYGAVFALLVSAAFSREFGLIAAILLGIAKEAADYAINKRAIARGQLPPHGVEFYDALATSAGGALVYVAGALS